MRIKSHDALSRATAIGSCVPVGDFSFSVHSVFRRALNIKPSGERALLTIVPAGSDCPPRGIRIDETGGLDAWAPPAGTLGWRSGRTIFFEGRRGGRTARIDLSSAAMLDEPVLPRLDPRDPELEAAWRGCAARLASLQEARGTDLRLAEVLDDAKAGAAAGTAMGAALAAAIVGLARAMAANVESCGARDEGGDRRLALAAARLVGLGAGLTPSGDDFLCGLLAAVHSSFCEDIRERILSELRGIADIAFASTNAIGATYIACALEGWFSPALVGLARSLGAEGGSVPGAALCAIERLCSFGQGSGCDTATGFLFGLRCAMDGERRRHAR